MAQTTAELAVEGWFIAQAACQALGSFDPDRECLFSLGENGRLRALDGDGRNARRAGARRLRQTIRVATCWIFTCPSAVRARPGRSSWGTSGRASMASLP